MIYDILYRKSYDGMLLGYLGYLGQLEAIEVLKEVHNGACGTH